MHLMKIYWNPHIFKREATGHLHLEKSIFLFYKIHFEGMPCFFWRDLQVLTRAKMSIPKNPITYNYEVLAILCFLLSFPKSQFLTGRHNDYHKVMSSNSQRVAAKQTCSIESPSFSLKAIAFFSLGGTTD